MIKICVIAERKNLAVCLDRLTRKGHLETITIREHAVKPFEPV